jgi:hypothetical protein
MKHTDVSRTIVLGLLILVASTVIGCVTPVMAPRIPAMKRGPGAPFGVETGIPEPAMPLKEAPEGVRPSSVIK